MKWNGCVDLLNILRINLNATIYVNELILTRFSPFDSRCKKPNVKNLWKFIFRAEEVFRFPNAALDHGGCPPYHLELLQIMFKYLVQVLCNI